MSVKYKLILLNTLRMSARGGENGDVHMYLRNSEPVYLCACECVKAGQHRTWHRLRFSDLCSICGRSSVGQIIYLFFSAAAFLWKKELIILIISIFIYI